MEWHRIETLKDQLLHEADPGLVFQYFFDHVAGQPGFIAAGKPVAPAVDALLGAVVTRTVPHLIGKAATLTEMHLTEVPGHHFIHGTVDTDAGVCIILYLEDLKVGLLSFTEEVESGFMFCGRFTTLPTGEDQPLVLPMRNQTGH